MPKHKNGRMTMLPRIKTTTKRSIMLKPYEGLTLPQTSTSENENKTTPKKKCTTIITKKKKKYDPSYLINDQHI